MHFQGPFLAYATLENPAGNPRGSILTKSSGVVFKNTTNSPVDILWVNPEGENEIYADGVPPGDLHVQLSNPGQAWQINSGEKVIGTYKVKANPIQDVDLSRL